jgi:hypothetical protein
MDDIDLYQNQRYRRHEVEEDIKFLNILGLRVRLSDNEPGIGMGTLWKRHANGVWQVIASGLIEEAPALLRAYIDGYTDALEEVDAGHPWTPDFDIPMHQGTGLGRRYGPYDKLQSYLHRSKDPGRCGKCGWPSGADSFCVQCLKNDKRYFKDLYKKRQRAAIDAEPELHEE